jgi:hypothetical protein
MNPRIQYARTSDGVSIAYWTTGEGSPLVVMPIAANLFSDRGEFAAKGFEDPVRVYEVRWRESAEPA